MDILSQKVVPSVRVSSINQIAVYSDTFGKACWVNWDSAYCIHPNYKSKKIFNNDSEDTIYLIPSNYIKLDLVEVSATKNPDVVINENLRFWGSHITIQSGDIYGFEIDENHSHRKVAKVEFFLAKPLEGFSRVRLHFLSVSDTMKLNYQNLLHDNLLFDIPKDKKKVSIDLESYNVRVPDKDVVFALEFIIEGEEAKLKMLKSEKPIYYYSRLGFPFVNHKGVRLETGRAPYYYIPAIKIYLED